MNEQQTIKVVAKLISAIHGRPRQSLSKVTVAEVERVVVDEDGPWHPNSDLLQGAMADVQRSPQRIVPTEVDGDTDMAKLAQTDPARAAIEKIHSQPRLCSTPRLGSKAVNDVIAKRMDEEK